MYALSRNLLMTLSYIYDMGNNMTYQHMWTSVKDNSKRKKRKKGVREGRGERLERGKMGERERERERAIFNKSLLFLRKCTRNKNNDAVS